MKYPYMNIIRIAALTACLVLAGCSNAPDTAATEFTEAAAAGRTAEALERLDPERRRMADMKLTSAVRRAAADAERRGGLKDVRVVESEKSDGDHATVTVELRFGDGTTKRDVHKVRKVDGEWFVTM